MMSVEGRVRIKTRSGITIRLIGFKAEPDDLFLLCELVGRVPGALLGYRLDGVEHNVVYAVCAADLVVEMEAVMRLNNRSITGTFIPGGSS